MGTDPEHGAIVRAGDALVGKILDIGVDGVGPWRGAEDLTGEIPRDPAEIEREIDRVVASHRRLVAAAGFITGLGGLATLPVAVPADVLNFYLISARMTAAIARLRGYDLRSPHVRTTLLVVLAGAQGTAALSEAGIAAGTRAATGALQRLPGQALSRVNRRVGARLVTRLGRRGGINLVRVVPVVGGGIGAGVNVVGINAVAAYARRSFPPAAGASAPRP